MTLNICENANVLEVLKLVKMAINIIKVIVPIIIIVMTMIDFTSSVQSGEEDILKKKQKALVTRAIACVLIFFVPTLVSIIVELTTSDTKYEACFSLDTNTSITDAYISAAEKQVSQAEKTLNPNDYYNAVIAVNKIKNNDDREPFQKRLDAIKEKIDNNNNNDNDDENTNQDNDNTNSPVITSIKNDGVIVTIKSKKHSSKISGYYFSYKKQDQIKILVDTYQLV